MIWYDPICCHDPEVGSCSGGPPSLASGIPLAVNRGQ